MVFPIKEEAEKRVRVTQGVRLSSINCKTAILMFLKLRKNDVVSVRLPKADETACDGRMKG